MGSMIFDERRAGVLEPREPPSEWPTARGDKPRPRSPEQRENPRQERWWLLWCGFRSIVISRIGAS